MLVDSGRPYRDQLIVAFSHAIVGCQYAHRLLQGLINASSAWSFYTAL